MLQTENADRLYAFIEASKAKGASDEALSSILLGRGWPREEITAAFGNYWERATGIAIPERAGSGGGAPAESGAARKQNAAASARDGFLYLLSFSTLAIWAGALGSILFSFIDRWFPDAVTGYPFLSMRKEVTWQMASIAVAFPIYLLVMRSIVGEVDRDPRRLQSGVRKWLTYIALLLTSVAMIGDLVWFLDALLTGDLRMRFVLKSLTVLSICGAIFVYYLQSLRWEEKSGAALAKRRSVRFGVTAAAAVVAAFLVGFGVAGTPSAQRRIEADARRVDDLKAIASAIYAWHQRAASDGSSSAGPLPKRLAELSGKGVMPPQIKDPESGRLYAYQVKSESKYQLCATFAGAEESYRAYQTNYWHHGKGETCFALDASGQPVW